MKSDGYSIIVGCSARASLFFFFPFLLADFLFTLVARFSAKEIANAIRKCFFLKTWNFHDEKEFSL